MGQYVDDIKKNLSLISEEISVLDILIEFERILDNCNIYAYKNWENGELVSGPDISKYWVKTTWMFPYDLMPDPRGGLRLLKYNCKIYFKEDVFICPVKVRGPSDIQDPISKKAKIKETPIWLVTIEMPRKFIDNGLSDFLNIEQDNTLNVDTSEIETAIDQSADVSQEIDLDPEQDI